MAVFDADKDISPGIVVSVPFFGGILALLMIGVLMKKVRAAPRGEGPQLFIADQIAEGAVAFLKTEYSYLVPFVVICAAFIVGILEGQSGSPVDYSDNKGGWQTTVCFLSGASLSALAGWMGMKIATETNVKTMQAAKESLNSALKIAFAGGAVMGFYVVALGILGLVVLFYAFSMGQDNAPEDGTTFDPDMRDAIRYLSGFGFGASSIALFARVAGGIYTKAADVGADLVGKVESDIPEDDPRNPATVADNVGDNVGDVAGMGADLFESFVGSIIACASLASSHAEIALPFWVAGFGILAATIGFWTVSTKDDADQSELLHALHRGVYSSSILVIVFDYLRRNFVQRFQVGLQVLRLCPHRSHRGYLSRRSHGILHVLRVHSGQIHHARRFCGWCRDCHHPRFGHWYDLCLPADHRHRLDDPFHLCYWWLVRHRHLRCWYVIHAWRHTRD